MIKTDDDVIINMAKFNELALLQDLDVPFYGGKIVAHSKPFRSGRWEVTMEEFPGNTYPHFVLGGGYILNKLALHALLQVHRSGVQAVFHNEDVYVGVLASLAKVTPVSLSSTFHFSDPRGWCKEPATVVLMLQNCVPIDMHATYMECFRKYGTFCI